MKSLALVCLLVVVIIDNSVSEEFCKCTTSTSPETENDATQWCEYRNPSLKCVFHQEINFNHYHCKVPGHQFAAFAQCCKEFISVNKIPVTGAGCREIFDEAALHQINW